MRLIIYLNEQNKSTKLTEQDIAKLGFLSFDRRINHEAQYFSLDDIRVGSKFFDLPDKKSQKSVLIHELGHFVSDELLKDKTIWEWYDKGYFFGEFGNRKVEGLNGKTVPGEVIAEAYSVFFTEPDFLRKHYSKLYQELKQVLNDPKYKEVNKITQNILKL